MDKPNVIRKKFTHGKSKNKRITILLLYNKKEKKHFYVVKTKTLVDFKTRNILFTENVYSVETFNFLADTFSFFTHNSEVKNKILNIELSKMNKMVVTHDLNI